MESRALSDSAFPAFSKKVIPYLHITSKVKGAPHADLAKEKGVHGFPTLMFLDEKGDPIASPNKQSVDGFNSIFKQVSRFVRLRKRVAKGEKSLVNELFLAELEIHKIEHKEATARFASLKGLTAQQENKANQLLINSEVYAHIKAAYAAFNRGGRNEVDLKYGKLFAEMAAKKRIPNEDTHLFTFWSMMAKYAKSESDIDLFSKAFNVLQQTYGKQPGYGRVLGKLQRDLEALRKAKPQQPNKGTTLGNNHED